MGEKEEKTQNQSDENECGERAQENAETTRQIARVKSQRAERKGEGAMTWEETGRCTAAASVCASESARSASETRNANWEKRE